jgi:hypothetical protein
MAEEQTVPTRTETRVARARPLSGAILGILIGLALAVLLQQQGVWPLDQLTVFLLPAATGVIGLVLTSVKRVGAPGPMIVAFIILIPMAAWGATGFSTLNEVGQLNGGCEVQAQTSVPDSTNVIDTSKQDPFLIDPNGSLQWAATSPVVFNDYPWNIWVEIGGAQITLDSKASQNNDGGSQINGGDVANVTAYAAERGIDISLLRGVYKVGGSAANTCDGFGFVKIISNPLETIIAKIAAALVALLTILLLIIAFTGRTRPVEVPVGADGVDGDLSGDAPAGDNGAGGAAAAGAAAGAAGDDNDTGGDGDVGGDTVEGYEPGSEDLPERDDLA